MAKLRDQVVSTNADPLVRWETVYHVASNRSERLSPAPPPLPDGYEDGCWQLDQVQQLFGEKGPAGLAVKWVFCAGPNDIERKQALRRAATDLCQAVASLFEYRSLVRGLPEEEGLAVRRTVIEPPDTSNDRWLWETLHKWAQALRDGKPR